MMPALPPRRGRIFRRACHAPARPRSRITERPGRSSARRPRAVGRTARRGRRTALASRWRCRTGPSARCRQGRPGPTRRATGLTVTKRGCVELIHLRWSLLRCALVGWVTSYAPARSSPSMRTSEASGPVSGKLLSSRLATSCTVTGPFLSTEIRQVHAVALADAQRIPAALGSPG